MNSLLLTGCRDHHLFRSSAFGLSIGLTIMAGCGMSDTTPADIPDRAAWKFHRSAEPISDRYLVMLATGLYVPVALLPEWLGAVGRILPQTYAFAAARAIVLTGADWSDPNVGPNIVGLAVGALLAVAVGVALLNLALRRAERRGGIGVVV